MPNTSSTLLLWTPRILGITMSLFVGIFALDAFSTEQTFFEAVGAFGIHLMPALLLLAVALLSWRWPLIGALAFTGLALVYAYWARYHLAWILGIAWPLLLVGMLFLLSWMDGRRPRAAT